LQHIQITARQIEKFIKEISFIQRSGANSTISKYMTPSCFLSLFYQTT
jgi:hypothetical protein